MDEALARHLAAQLAAATRAHRTVAPFTHDRPDLDIATAYRAQDLLLAAREAAGERVIGAKLAFTSEAKRRMVGVAEPGYGFLTDAMVAPGGAIRLAGLVHPRGEPEIGVRLGRDLQGPGVTAGDARAAADAAFAAIEIVDTRFHDYRFGAADNIADNTAAARVVLGARVPADGLDLAALGVTFELNGEMVAATTGAAAMGDPAEAVAWLANALATRGRGLRAGDIVITGGLTESILLCAGDTLRARIEVLGIVEAHGVG